MIATLVRRPARLSQVLGSLGRLLLRASCPCYIGLAGSASKDVYLCTFAYEPGKLDTTKNVHNVVLLEELSGGTRAEGD